MAKVKKGYYARLTWDENTFKAFIDSLNCPLITTSHDSNITTINVNNIVSVNFGNGKVTVVYNGQTVATYSILNSYNDLHITAAFNDNFFYFQVNCDYSYGRRFVFLYETIDNKNYFGYNGAEVVSGRGWFSIHEITMIETESNLNYNHAARLPYNCQTGLIDYASPDFLFSVGYKTDTEDNNFISCSTVIVNQVITFGGTNYYSIGTNTLVELDD